MFRPYPQGSATPTVALRSTGRSQSTHWAPLLCTVTLRHLVYLQVMWQLPWLRRNSNYHAGCFCFSDVVFIVTSIKRETWLIIHVTVQMPADLLCVQCSR